MSSTRASLRFLFAAFFALVPLTRAFGAIAGIDPLAVLDTQPKANAIVVLDSGGDMRDMPSTLSGSSGIHNGELVGSDPGSKLFGAKEALKRIFLRNQAIVRFKLGRFSQDTADSAYFPSPGSTFVIDRFYYATTDPSAASLSINSTGNGTTAPGASRNVANDTVTVPSADGAPPTTHYYLRAGRFWNGETLKRSGTKWAVDASVPVVRTHPATLRVNTGSAIVVFTFRGLNWARSNDSQSCQGFTGLVELPSCSVTDQYKQGLSAPLEDELDFNPDGSIAGYQDGALGDLPRSYPTARGVRAVGSTPIGAALGGIRDWLSHSYSPTLAEASPSPRTFVILIAGSDDNCSGFDPNNDGSQTQADTDNALAAAYQAQQLFQHPGPGTGSVATYVIAYGASLGLGRANWIAWAGSGLALGTTVKNGITIWNKKPKPTDPEVLACKAAGGCIDAFSAADAVALQVSLQATIDVGVNGTEVSASPAQTTSIYEYAQAFAGIDPTDPGKRYAASAPISVQSTFDGASFRGKLTAFASPSGGPPVAQWEAGAKLAQRVSISTPASFRALTAGAVAANIGTSNALVKRRIFTSPSNGVFTSALLFGANARGSGAVPVSLWPPDIDTSPVVAPDSDTDAGFFDEALGIVGDGGDAELAALQSRYGACKGSPLPPSCSMTTTVARTDGAIQVRVARARREAREIILAHTAGAAAARDINGRPLRSSAGDVLYVARGWMLGESTLATPVIAGPPPEANTLGLHGPEYSLFRDGPRTESGHQAVNGLDLGFGLRHPDRDGAAASRSDLSLKPIMSVAYVATNQMLHAFRAGPCPAGTCRDTGGEELWGFVPFDQLSKLADLATKPPLREPHTYMIATSPRIADVFVPAPGGRYQQSVGETTFGGTGKWRTVLLFGRGAGGKYLTALDVTAPGPLTRAALDHINPPLVLWNRGNPDTRNGAVGGPPNNSLVGNGDAATYAQMGETWSIPAVVPGERGDNVTPRTAGGIDVVAYVGSGYSDVGSEGHTFYALDPLTGDVIHAQDVGARSPATPGMISHNALVASPSVFTPARLGDRNVDSAVTRLPTRVYIGDVQGQVWRFSLGPAFTHRLFYDFGADGGRQPITTSAALLDFDGNGTGQSTPHIYVATGGDRRVETAPFQMVGLRDDDGPSATVLFAHDFPDRPAPGYRGTLDPIAMFNDQGRARIFFGATQMAAATTSCAASMSTALFALTGETGSTAFALDGQKLAERPIVLAQTLLTGFRMAKTPRGTGQLIVSNAVGTPDAGPSPPVPPPSGTTITALAPTDVVVRSIKTASPVCR